LNLIFSVLVPLQDNRAGAEASKFTQQAFENIYSRLERARTGKSFTVGGISTKKSVEMYAFGVLYDINPEAIYNLEMRCNAWRSLIAQHLEKRIGNTKDKDVVDAGFRTVPDVPETPPQSDPRWDASKKLVDQTFDQWTKMGRLTPKTVKEFIKNMVKDLYRAI
jgi:hypothetical protein